MTSLYGGVRDKLHLIYPAESANSLMRIVFVQKFVPHYRLPFFERVKETLEQRGIEFVLIYCEPDPYENSKVQMVYPEWGIRASTRHFSVFKRYLYWANVFKHLKRGDLVIAEHAAKLIDNYIIFAARQTGWLKMGYFGHGENFQATTEFKISAIIKKLMLRRVDHWFAYTDVSRASLQRQGVDESIITVVNNTLAVPANAHLGKQPPDAHTCIYIGGLYTLKLLPLLIDAASRVAQEIPTFKLEIVGEGPDKPLLQEAAETRPWLTVHGALYGLERDSLLASANAILMPGLVGLIAIDSFQFERPVLTSTAGEHSPEIAYLVDQENCLIDEGDVTAESYGDMIVRYLNDTSLQDKLRAGCRDSAALYSIDNMADNFCDAVGKSS